ncbi:MAG TPA: cytochrome c [Ohtaekwangia sp.]
MKKVVLVGALTVTVISFFSFTQKFDLKASIARGKEVYEANCVTCHMAEGEGIEGAFPPLAKSDYLTDKARLVKVVLMGVRGPMKINGVQYDAEMPGVSLTDEQVSDVLNYIRNSWGNKGAAITPGEVQPSLKVVSKDYQAY